ncbi:MAG: hypothetical protein E7311_00665 [Clostridiales bacterium]|nr:hypothetical protein [Clostridiales bacterium]
MKQINNEIPFKEKLKRTLFNRFYLDLIAYFIILAFGLLLSASLYFFDKNVNNGYKIFFGIFITLVIFVMLYILGYLSARKKKGSNKYISCFGIYVSLFIVYIISTIFYNESKDNFFLIDFINRVKNIVLVIHSYIFNWFDILCAKDIPSEIYVLLTPFIMFLGSRHNRIQEIRRIKIKKMKERREKNG